MFLKRLAALLILFTVSGHFSQNKERKKDTINQLDEVIITATRTKRQLATLPMPIQIIKKVDIKNSNSMRLSEILNEQTGLISVPDFGGGEGLQIQGLDSQYTLILVDGVPLIGRSAGTLDLNRVSVGNIKQIEIVKGASSSLYGSEALGGVVNIITEKPKKGTRGDLNARSGTFNTHDLGVSFNQRKNNLGITAFINRNSSDGFDFDETTSTQAVNPFENYTFDTKLSYDFSNKFDVVLAGRIFTQNQQNTTQNLSTQEVFTGKSNIFEWNTRLTSTYKISKKFETIFEFYATQFTTDEFLNDSNGVKFSSSEFDQRFIRPEFRSTWTINKKSELSSGFGLTNETLDRSFFMETPVFNAPFVFAQYDWKPNEKLNVIAGARFDGHNQYQSQFNPKLAINYDITENLSVKASAGRGFKAPDFRQLFFNFSNSTVGYRVLGYNLVTTIIPELVANNQAFVRQGIDLNDFNNDLKPESSNNYNLGFSYRPFSNIKTAINFFRNDISNLIDTRAIATLNASGQNIFSYVNISEVFTQGLEFDATYQPNDRLKVAFGYQLLYAKDKDAIRAFEAREVNATSNIILTQDQYFGLFNRSRHMGNFKVFYEIPKWNSNINLRTTYRSRYGLFDTNTNGYLDTFDDFARGYAIVDIAFNKTLWNDYEIGFGSDNLLDFTDPQNANNIPGRIIYGKLNIKF